MKKSCEYNEEKEKCTCSRNIVEDFTSLEWTAKVDKEDIISKKEEIAGEFKFPSEQFVFPGDKV